MRDRGIDIPSAGLDTPHGRLYRPRSTGEQIAVLFLAFVAGPVLGGLVAAIPGDLSEVARTVLQASNVLIFFAGYAIWVARLNALAFDLIGRSLLKALFVIVFRRRKPDMPDVLPTREKLLELVVRAQRAGGSFGPVSIPIGLAAGALALFFDTALGAFARFALAAGSCIAWGHLLAWLGRHGWLPFPEGEA